MSSNPETSVYVGNIDPRVTKEQLYELFIQVAPVINIKYPKDKILQKYQGYAFIQFETEKDVEYVINVLHNTVSLYDRLLKIRKSTTNTRKNVGTSSSNITDKLEPPIAKLFVKGLDESIDNKMLQSYFNKLGPLYRSPEIFYVHDNSIRCAFIYYRNYKDADEAINKFNDQLLANKMITVEYAFKENNRSQRYGNDIDRLLNKEALKNGLL